MEHGGYGVQPINSRSLGDQVHDTLNVGYDDQSWIKDTLPYNNLIAIHHTRTDPSVIDRGTGDSASCFHRVSTPSSPYN